MYGDEGDDIHESIWRQSLGEPSVIMTWEYIYSNRGKVRSGRSRWLYTDASEELQELINQLLSQILADYMHVYDVILVM